MFDPLPAIDAFFRRVAAGEIEIYNEFSLQHELGLLLRADPALGRRRVQFERPIAYFFDPAPTHFTKKELDLVIFRPDQAERIALELKFPRNGQYPEQMFKFCQDIAFLEELVLAGFDAGWFIVVVEHRPFYWGKSSGIYSYFRGGAPLAGTVLKPTGSRDEAVVLRGTYTIRWCSAGRLRYACLRVAPSPWGTSSPGGQLAGP